MNLFNFLQVDYPNLKPENAKIHLAVSNGEEHPIDVYLRGDFEEWQSWQTKRNFGRDYIVSLIQMDKNDTWLFAGVYRVLELKEKKESEQYYIYDTEELEVLKQYSGRVVVNFKRERLRQSYLVAENWFSEFSVIEMLAEPIAIGEFKGYDNSVISKQNLDIVIKQSVKSWKSALSNVLGIYLITDINTGKLYVGSASGEDGIWQRWVEYSKDGHGNNQELIDLLDQNGESYANNFQYTVLEIADTHASLDDIYEREKYWKKVLCSRKHGYNAN